jgi:ribonuclease P protein component
MFRFPKNQKLCNNTDIVKLFDQGTSISLHPFRIVWFNNENIDGVLIKSLIVVPKKRIKLAIQRNTIKRYIRESYRARKFKLEEQLKNQQKQINFAIIYNTHKELCFKDIDVKINLIINRLINTL